MRGQPGSEQEAVLFPAGRTRRRMAAAWVAVLLFAVAGPKSVVATERPVVEFSGWEEAPPPHGDALGLLGTPELLPPMGRVEALAIFAQFADEAEKGESLPDFASTLFDPELPGSLAHFYDTMSCGQLRIRGQVLPRRYTADRSGRAYVTKTPGTRGRYGQFVDEILQKVDADVDLGRYDNDGPDGMPNSGDDDGVVDYVFVLMRSTPPNFILSRATGTVGLGLVTDHTTEDLSAGGGTIRVRGTQDHGSILRAGGIGWTVGSMAHEFGHSLGLPDLYDLSYDGPEDDSAGIGAWGLMGRGGATGWRGDDGPNPLCAWSRQQLGWLGEGNERLVQVEQDTQALRIDASVDQGGIVPRIVLGAQPSHTGKAQTEEYLLLELRRRDGSYYERHLPAEGLLVWHACERQRTNNVEQKKLLDLVCADGRYQDLLVSASALSGGEDDLDFWAHDADYRLEHGGNLGDATDLFDGARFSGCALLPAATRGGAANTGLALKIRRQGAGMVVDVRLPRWAGTISGRVNWQGQVLVDGDVTVAPEGMLMIFSNTRVRFAPSDRLRQGGDPERCELRVEGVLRVDTRKLRRHRPGYWADVEMEQSPALLEALVPGGTWQGVFPVGDGEVQLLEGGVVLRDTVAALPGAMEDQSGGLRTAVDVEPAAEGAEFSLGPGFPNPFAERTTLPYSLATSAQTRLQVYNGLGQEVRRLVDGYQEEGRHEAIWDGEDESGRQLASGMYIARMDVPGQFAAHRKMMRLEGGFSSVSRLDSILGTHAGELADLSGGMSLQLAPQFGVTGRDVAPNQVAFTLGALAANLQLLGGHPRALGEQVEVWRQVWRRLGEVTPETEGLLAQLLVGTRTRRAALTQLRAAAEGLLDEEQAAFFYLGEWSQTLRTAGQAAQRRDVGLETMVDAAADAAASRRFAEMLRAYALVSRNLEALAQELSSEPARVDSVLARLGDLRQALTVR
jgi:M6 family metalloprotease-like protein